MTTAWCRSLSNKAVATTATGAPVIKPRPRSLKGSTYRTQTPIGTAWITITENEEHEPFEVFVQVGKGGSDTMAVAEALGRLISLILRLPSPLSAQRRLEGATGCLTVNTRTRSIGVTGACTTNSDIDKPSCKPSWRQAGRLQSHA